MSAVAASNRKYRVARSLGAGAMGTVDLAMHVATERQVVLKRPHRRLQSDPDILARFEREARAAGRIRSAHVVEIMDVDEDDDGPYLVMEFLEGETLSARLARSAGQRLSVEETIELVEQILVGAAAAHRANVIHRDLKAANVFVAREVERGGAEIIKILDFGVCKLIEERVRDLTETGALVGTLSHVSPEQIRGENVSYTTDLWSIGIIAFTCIAGTHPFSGEAGADDLSVLGKILQGERRPLPDDLAPAVRAALDSFFDRALARLVEERFASADEMRAALEPVRAAVRPRPIVMAATAQPAPQTQTQAQARTQTQTQAKATRPTAIFLLPVAAVVLGVWLGWSLKEKEPAGTTAPPPTTSIDVHPTHAVLRLDGIDVPDRSNVVLPHDGSEAHELRVEAPGFLSRTVKLPKRAGAHLVVTLAPLSPPTPAPTTPTTPTPIAAPSPVAVTPATRPAKPQNTAHSTPAAAPTPKPIVKPPY